MRGCLPIIQEVLYSSLVRTPFLFCVEVVLSIIIMLELTLAAVTFCYICSTQKDDEHNDIDLVMDRLTNHITGTNTMTYYQPTHYVWTDLY